NGQKPASVKSVNGPQEPSAAPEAPARTLAVNRVRTRAEKRGGMWDIGPPGLRRFSTPRASGLSVLAFPRGAIALPGGLWGPAGRDLPGRGLGRLPAVDRRPVGDRSRADREDCPRRHPGRPRRRVEGGGPADSGEKRRQGPARPDPHPGPRGRVASQTRAGRPGRRLAGRKTDESPRARRVAAPRRGPASRPGFPPARDGLLVP